MALGDTYATLDELKSYMSLADQAVLVDDELTDALQTATEEIERVTHRQFNNTEGVASARVFPPDDTLSVRVDDFHTITGLIVKTDLTGDGTFEQTWSAADYELSPLNGIVAGQPGWPFWSLEATQALRFPVKGYRSSRGNRATVQITAQWGWARVPAPIKQACLLLAAENYQLKDAPLGVAGMGEFGVVRVRNNRMAAEKLQKYTRTRVMVG